MKKVLDLNKKIDINKIAFGCSMKDIEYKKNEFINLKIENNDIYNLDIPMYYVLPYGLDMISIYLLGNKNQSKYITYIGFVDVGIAYALNGEIEEYIADEFSKSFELINKPDEYSYLEYLKYIDFNYWIFTDAQKEQLNNLLKSITVDNKISIKDLIIFQNEFNTQLQETYNQKYEKYEKMLIVKNSQTKCKNLKEIKDDLTM